MSFPYTPQLDQMDCGPACLRMVASYHGRTYSLQMLRERAHITRQGVSLLGISEAAEGIGLRTIAVKLGYERTGEQPGLLEFPVPFIAHWQQRHFVVVYKCNARYVWVADPAHGKLKMSVKAFKESWCSDGASGIALGLEPTPAFYQEEGDGPASTGWGYLFGYLRPYSGLLTQFGIGMGVGLLLQLLFPFMAQSLVDVGIQQRDMGFIWLILLAQLTLFVGQTSVQFIQAWILLQVGRRVNVALIADFLSKLMRLPLGYFDSKNTGDLMQRISDNSRIEGFLTGSLLRVLLAGASLVVFSGVLLLFDVKIFLVFAGFSGLYLLWVWAFMKRRRDLDYLYFGQMSDNNQNLYELINGMQEVKLQGSERKRRWKWIDVQAKLFRVQSKSLALRQYQEFGAFFITRFKDIIISFLTARAVVEGDITLGSMMAVQYIVGQLNGPFEQLIGFVRDAQDARISLERMGEITQVTEEDAGLEGQPMSRPAVQDDIILQDLSFRYSAISDDVLKSVSFQLPKGKTTAIVGASGSGKTTLLKLLLGFYKPTSGQLRVGSQPLTSMNLQHWRARCGAVMQEGFIFSDTIANNIAESTETLDAEKLHNAIEVANLGDFIYGLPLGYNTVIGPRGTGLSQGQRQRVLIARAVYKNPDYLFLDEATNSLDANNERKIVQNLETFLRGKTVMVIAHRLSTVRNADQIVVLHKGEVSEIGTHEALIAKRGLYYELIQNQLEL